VAVTCSPAQAREWTKEVYKCVKSFVHFADTHCRILEDDGRGGAWVRFRLWPDQRRAGRALQENRLVVILKARQLGLSWLVLAFALWLLLFHPIATVLLFSRRDDEAVDLLANRLRGMYDRLPEWLKVRGFTTDNDHEWGLSTGSRALAFPTTAGDSYCATLALVDEADLCPDLGRLMRSVKPTIDAGGRMVLVSRAEKGQPESVFKRTYRGAVEKANGWTPVFLPWDARPDRDAAWYDAQKADILARTGCLDDLHEQYPATPEEALAPRSLDKRIPAAWLLQCFVKLAPLPAPAGAPAVPGLVVYRPPEPSRRYVVGADPAEGNPTSNDSAASVLDEDTGEEVATFAGRFEPSTFASYIDAVGTWYNRADVLVERNNHGHAVLLWLVEHSRLHRLPGPDERPGWLSSPKGKALLYATCAEAFRDRETQLHSFSTYTQLCSIDGGTLKAPDGQNDDRADSYALALQGIIVVAKTTWRVFRKEDVEAAMNPKLKPIFGGKPE
jgi:hypothetical protein